MLQLVRRHVVENQEIGFIKVWYGKWFALYQVLAGNVTYSHYKLGTTTKLSMPFQVLRLGFTLERNILLTCRSDCN